MKRILIGLALLGWSIGVAAQNCIPSGVSDQYTYFVAVNGTDKVSRETGLSGFTVVRSRNGGADATFDNPTVAEIDSSTMPGVYALLLDEDMTIGTGNDTEHMALHITATGMEPVTKEICIARAKITEGETLTVSAGFPASNSMTPADLGYRTVLIDSVSSQTELVLEAGTDTPSADDGAYDGWGVIIVDESDPSQIATVVASCETGYDGDTLTLTLATAPSFTVAAGDTVILGPSFGCYGVDVASLRQTALANLFDTDSGETSASAVSGSVVQEIADLASGGGLTEAGIADAVLEELVSDHSGTSGSLAAVLGDILVDTGTTLDNFVDGIESAIAAQNDVSQTEVQAAAAAALAAYFRWPFKGIADSGDTNTLVDAALGEAFTTDADLTGVYVVRADGQRCFVDSYDASEDTIEFGSCTFTGAWSTQGYDMYPAGTQ